MISEWSGTDWASIITALSVLLGTTAPIYFKVRDVEKKVEATHELANGNLTKRDERIEQLTRELNQHGLPIPPSKESDDNEH